MSHVQVDFGKSVDTIRALHGVNNGPRTYSFYHNTSKYFVEAGIPYARLHDTEYPYGSGHFVDIPCIFKDFDADPYDPASYDFAMTDMYIQAIYDCGTKVFYRLGVSIEHGPVKRCIYPPKDFHKWAVVCEHIIRHYNEGWANGFNYGIEYWEIWNEPESDEGQRTTMWLGSDDDYCNLYTIAANHLKKCFPKIKVGGYAACGVYGPFLENPTPRQLYYVDCIRHFFAHITNPDTRAPLDFFSWHMYTGELEMVEKCARFARELMAEYGLEAAESILNEWNYAGPDPFNLMRNEVGASMLAGALCIMQHNGVDLAHYYDAQPAMHYCGIFSLETRTPTKAFYSLKSWNELYKLKNEVESSSDCEQVRVCAAGSDGKGGILISSYKTDDPEVFVSVSGFEGKNGVRARVYATDKNHFYELVSEEVFLTGQIRFLRKKDEHTMFYIELEAI